MTKDYLNCPNCGESDKSKLEVNAGETIKCTSCNKEYKVK